MTGTLTYAVTTDVQYSRGANGKRKETRTPGETATGVVWSPGPRAETVWVLPYSGASQSEAVCVHAPTPKLPFWYRESAPWGTAETFSRVTWRHERKPITMAETLAHITAPRNTPGALEAHVYRVDMHYAPQLPRKTWLAALGIDNVAQLALDAEDVAA